MMRKVSRWILYLIAPVTLLALPLGLGRDVNKFFRKVVLNPQKTGITTLNFYDITRDRPLTTEVWYPVSSNTPAATPSGIWLRCKEARNAPLSDETKTYPLIVFSHGSSGDRFNVSWLAEVLAANGYIVAAVDHFGNTWNNRIPACYAQPWDRPQDISFVLDQLLLHSPFKDNIDKSRIGFAGYSLGGATGIWVVGAEAHEKDIDQMKGVCLHEFGDIVTPEVMENIDFHEACRSFLDPRISAAFVMAPALGWLFDETSLQKIDVPVYIVAPEKDEIVPLETNAQILAQKISKASLMVLSGDASHFIFLNRPTLMGKRFLDAKYWKDPESIDREKIHRKLSETAVGFFGENLR